MVYEYTHSRTGRNRRSYIYYKKIFCVVDTFLMLISVFYVVIIAITINFQDLCDPFKALNNFHFYIFNSVVYYDVWHRLSAFMCLAYGIQRCSVFWSQAVSLLVCSSYSSCFFLWWPSSQWTFKTMNVNGMSCYLFSEPSLRLYRFHFFLFCSKLLIVLNHVDNALLFIFANDFVYFNEIASFLTVLKAIIIYENSCFVFQWIRLIIFIVEPSVSPDLVHAMKRV